MIKDLKAVSLVDILPDNLLADTQVYAAAKALDDELQRVTVATWEALHLPRLDELPEAVLDLLAWQWHVDFYEPMGMSVETKRSLIRKSIAWHRMKGTPAAVEEVVTAAFDKTTVSEWFEYGGQPYYFKVITEDVTTNKERLDMMRRAIEIAKNARSILESIEFLLHLQDTENVTEESIMDACEQVMEYYPWDGRCFNGAYSFGGCQSFNGAWLFDGERMFNGVPTEDEAPQNMRPYIFDGIQVFDGMRRFEPYSTEKRILFDSAETDHMTDSIVPELSDQYGITFRHDGAIGFDGSTIYGFNKHPHERTHTDYIAQELIDAEHATDSSITMLANAIVADNYPIAEIRLFDGTWRFNIPKTFNGAEWFGGEWMFDAAERLDDPTTPGNYFDGSAQFDGTICFKVPSLAARYDSYGSERLETAHTMAEIAEHEQPDEYESTETVLVPMEKMARLVFDGSAHFNGTEIYTTYGKEEAAESVEILAADSLENTRTFNGEILFNGDDKAELISGPAETESVTITQGRWFDGTIYFDAAGAYYFDGTIVYNGDRDHALTRSSKDFYNAAGAFDGSKRFTRGGETFEQWSYSA